VNRPEVIFTTAYRDYALDGFELNAIDYLLKPIFFERFFSAIQKFLKQERPADIPVSIRDHDKVIDYIFVNKSKKQVRVLFDDVLYIESLKDYIRIYMTNETLVIKESISSFEKKVDQRFARIHRSFIVNQEKITAFTKNDVEIGEIEIPIGRNYKTQIAGRLA